VVIGLALAGCDAKEEYLGGTPSPPVATSSSPDMAALTARCQLPEAGSTAPGGSERWSGWESFSTDLVETVLMSSEAAVRAVVLTEVQTRLDWGIQQDACLYVEEVYRGSSVASGDIVHALWQPGRPIDTFVFDDRIGYHKGGEYVVILNRSQARVIPPAGAYFTWLLDVYPLFLRSESDIDAGAPSHEAIDSLMGAIEGAPDIAAAGDDYLAGYGLTRQGPVRAGNVTFPRVPDVPGTVTRYTASDPFPWYTTYRHISDVLEGQGVEMDQLIGRRLYTLTVDVVPGDDRSNGIAAVLIATKDAVLGGWLITRDTVWPMDEVAEAAFSASVEAVATPANRAGVEVNVANWYGLSKVVDVKIKTGNSLVPEDALSTGESIAAFAAALDRVLRTAAITRSQGVGGCSMVGLFLDRADGYSIALDYDPVMNLLVAPLDGFAVDAPDEVAALLGLIPGSEGVCPPPNPPKVP
jgi:hypothetical protein